jgi:hypothetical protein
MAASDGAKPLLVPPPKSRSLIGDFDYYSTSCLYVQAGPTTRSRAKYHEQRLSDHNLSIGIDTRPEGWNPKRIKPFEKPLLPFEAAHHNDTHSFYHKLPLELMLEIVAYLPPLACFAMLQVCTKFRTWLTPYLKVPGPDKWKVADKLRFTFMLRRGIESAIQDEYNQACMLAQQHSTLRRYGCFGCRAIHERKDFSEKQINLPPNTRICKGLEASYRLCSHLSFSGECLMRGLRELRDAEMFCHGERDSRTVRGKDVINMEYFFPRIGFYEGRTITLDLAVPLFVIQKSHTTRAFLNTLRKAEVYICPHLSSASSDAFGGSPMMPKGYNDGGSRPLTWWEDILLDGRSPRGEYKQFDRLRQGKGVSWFQCPRPDCITRYCLTRVERWQPYLTLVISRDLFGGPTHPAMLAQRDQETSADEGISTSCTARFQKCTKDCIFKGYSTFMDYGHYSYF